jgi:Holliday junction resolvasome RuvABC ATP-dependent DNA helicase subunit
MEFQGQARLLREVALIENEIRAGRNLNIMLAAPSGWGKTTLALRIINNTVGLNGAYISGPPNFWIKREKRINFLDEVHMLDDPESLYPYLDLEKPSYILATNELGLVKEPLVRRCVPLVFDPYTVSDMVGIVSNILREFGLSTNVYESIANRCKLSPGIAKVLCQRMSYIFRNIKIPTSLADLDKLIEDVLAIDKSGLNSQDRMYLAILHTNGGRSSLDLLCNTLHLDRSTVLREIEPQLIYLGYVRISSKGRELLRWEN